MNFAAGLEFFDDEEYSEAVSALAKALDETDDNTVRAKILEKRALAHLCLSDYDAAVEDAAASLTLSSNSQGAYMAKGEALFHLDEYESAKSAFEAGLAVKGEAGKKAVIFQKWIRKCVAEIEEDEDEDEENKNEKEIAKDEEATIKPTTKAESDVSDSPVTTTVKEVSPKFRHDWYQTSDTVVITVMAKKQDPNNVSVDITTNNLTVEIKLDDGSGSSFVLDLDLFDTIDPQQSTHRLSPFKLEVKLRKKDNYQWGALEASDATMASRLPAAGSSSTAGGGGSGGGGGGVPSAYATKKDWNAIERQLKKEEEEEKPEGEEALNALFRQIYGNASEDTRRAMNKSFQTSGGTVLSTNWGEVGEKDYEKERQAPDGMEWKNWDGDKLDKEGKPIKNPSEQ